MRVGVNVSMWQLECCGVLRDGAWFAVDDVAEPTAGGHHRFVGWCVNLETHT